MSSSDAPHATDPTQAPAGPSPTVWPTLRCRDARALIAFLGAAFGFVENVVYGDGEVVEHAQLDWPEGGGVMLGSDRPGTSWARQPGTGASYVVTAHPDAVHDRAVAAGAEIVKGLSDQDYGSRDFIARDPEGNLWSFGTYPGAPPG
ncbi:MAG: VOC family protein [Actinobacteria bacterium]|nr:VOC family protein [Actinomycetota bacterium]